MPSSYQLFTVDLVLGRLLSDIFIARVVLIARRVQARAQLGAATLIVCLPFAPCEFGAQEVVNDRGKPFWLMGLLHG